MEKNIVSFSNFSVGGVKCARLDAEFVSPSLMQWEQAAAAHAGKRIASIVDAYTGPPVSDALTTAEAVVDYVAIDNVDTADGLVLPTQIHFEDRPSRAKFVLNEGDILVSNVRPNRGAVSLISARTAGALASSGFTLVRIAEPAAKAFSKEFVFAFLRSRFGRDQLIRRNRGSMYPAVLSDDVRDLWIPKPPVDLTKTVDRLVAKGLGHHDAFFTRHASQQSKLHTYLRQTFGAPPPSPLERDDQAKRHSIRSYADFFGEESAQRFDAEFFRPEYDEFEKKSAALSNTFILGDRYNCFAGRSPGNEVSEITYLRQSVLTNRGVNWSAAEIELGDAEPNSACARSGDILLACTAHEVYYVARKVDFVREVPEAAKDSNICVADIMIIRPKDIEREKGIGAFVAAFLRSDWGLHQVQRCIRGLRGGHVYGFDVERYVRVPEPTVGWLEEFEKHAAEAESQRDKGRHAIAEAVKVVETWAQTLATTNKREAAI